MFLSGRRSSACRLVKTLGTTPTGWWREPGKLLNRTRFSQAFFGAPIANLPKNVEIDHITLVWNGTPIPMRTLKLGDNGRDQLNVPPAEPRGEMLEHGQTLVFTRLSHNQFQLDDGSRADKK